MNDFSIWGIVIALFITISILYTIYIFVIKPIIVFFTPKPKPKEFTVDLNFTQSESKIPYFIFIDTETSGLPINKNGSISNSDNWPFVLQFAWIIMDEQLNEIKSESHYLKFDGFIHPAASAVNGITKKILKEQGKDRIEVFEMFKNDILHCKYLIGHNIDFDAKIVMAEFHRHGIDFSMKKSQFICTMKQTTEFCNLPKMKYPKLLELYSACYHGGRSLHTENTHDAETDVALTAKCFIYLVQKEILSIN